MRLEHIEFQSEALAEINRTMVLLPADDNEKIPVLYLLHGAGCSPLDFLQETDLEKLVDRYCMAVVMPECGNSVYLNHPDGKRYFDFITTELPQVVQNHLPVSDERGNTFIGGISMGGYGAIHATLKFPERFSKAFSLSGALRVKLGLRYMKVCGLELPVIQENLQQDVINMLNPHLALRPELMLRCGLGDLFLLCNQKFAERARNNGYTVAENFSPGDHDWMYWKRELPACLEWLVEGEK